MEPIVFCRNGAGFKPNKNPGKYNPKWLHGKDRDPMKMCNYDMRFIFQLLPDAEVDRLFSAATEEKIHARQRGSELRKIRRQDGSTEEIDGS